MLTYHGEMLSELITEFFLLILFVSGINEDTKCPLFDEHLNSFIWEAEANVQVGVQNGVRDRGSSLLQLVAQHDVRESSICWDAPILFF